ncbi:hypothetical protein [Halostella sp. PRR32]|uniref:hypothetical protein n=1 Tax=Halostella sp. PRR32 TaxID=3098147 RepID=UPI002B1D7AB3|nr:hypothetical protein [Halostella sp. PRR32]
MISTAYAGEDLPIRISYQAEDGTDTDPDDTDSDGTPDADITIVDVSDGSEVISATAMSNTGTGAFEYVWDTEVDANGEGNYRVEVAAEFSSETKITKDSITLR